MRRQQVYFRASLPPRMALFTCAWQGRRADPPPLVIRDRQGCWTPEYLLLRQEMGALAAFLQRAWHTRRCSAACEAHRPAGGEETIWF